MIAKLIILSISIFLIAQILPGVRLKKPFTAIVVAIVYSLVNYALGWILSLLALPLIIITLGLFNFVINAFLLWITDKIIDDFAIDGIKTTLLAAVLITIVNAVLNWVF
jgi:putative membrane protein